jgi:hypothetical protein
MAVNEQFASHTERRCERCAWWDTSTQSGSAESDTTGLCRRTTPGFDDRTGLAVWPFTAQEDWCGSFEESIEAKAGLV